MTDARFSRIVIIQSLPVGDSPTGRHLRDAIEATAKTIRGIPVEFISVQSANDFWMALDRVRESVQSIVDCPILHLECHGIDGGTGLALADRTLIPWSELKTPLVKLNQATSCNLLVTLAACHGAMLQETLDTKGRSPCLELLGPIGEVSPLDLKNSYSSFFLELLRSEKIEAALSALRESPERKAGYLSLSAVNMFQAVFRLYRTTCSTTVQMSDRVERFARDFSKLGIPDVKDNWIVSEMYIAERNILDRFYKRFFS